MRRITKFAIHGFYGQGNLGDEAILKAILQEFSKFFNIKIVVFSRNPKQVIATHKVNSVCSEGKRSFLHRVWEIKTSDLFVLGGGGLLKDYGSNSSNVEKWLKLLRLAKRLKVKTALCAVGIENIRYDKSKRLIKDALNSADLITVRDHISRDILVDLGITNEVKIVADPVILLSNNNIEKIRKVLMPLKVIICIRHWFDKGFYIGKPEVNENFIQSLSIAADFLVEHYNAKIEFIPFRITSYDDDRVVIKQVMSYMKRKDGANVYPHTPTVDEFINIIKESSLVIGMRLHSLILAASVGIPVIGLAYMPKVRGYMECIEQSKYSLDLETITSEKLTSLIDDVFKNYNAISKKILFEISKLQKTSRKNIIEMTELARK